MAYLLLLLTILTDIGATWLLKLSHGLTRYPLVILAMFIYVASKALFGLTLERLPLGYAYAVWCGIGTLLAFFIGNIQFKEPLSLFTWIGIFFIIAGIVCLELGSQAKTP